MKEENDNNKIGTIITNGINHWMIWSNDGKVVPVSFNEKTKEITDIAFSWRSEYWFNKYANSITPYWKIIGKMKFS